MSSKPEGESVIVPEFLDPGQNITDQPPFVWFEHDETIFPIDFFRDVPHAYIYFLRAVAFQYPWNMEEMNNWWTPPEVKRAYSVVNKKDYKQSINYAARKLREELDKYHLATEYLKQFLSVHSLFYINGTPRNVDDQVYTYAGYLAMETRLQERKKWLGLEEILPDASAAPEIAEAMPSKRQVNKFFRLYRSETLK